MAFECKHGQILYGTTCLNCEREREQITPKVTPQTPQFSHPRFLPGFAIADEILDKYVRMAAKWQVEWQREYEAGIARALKSGRPVIFGVDYADSHPSISIKVET